MALQKLALRPGLYREGTIYSNTGGWYDGDKIRFRSGLPEKIGGWQQYASPQFNGTARSLWAWSASGAANNTVYVGVGTNTAYQIFSAGQYYDVTPFIQTDTLSDPFTATTGSNIITVYDPSYQPNIGDTVIFSGATGLGGNISTIVLNTSHVVKSVDVNANTYTFVASATATGSDTGHGGTVTAQYVYPIGLNVYTTGNGWSAGPWGGAVNPIVVALGANPFATTNGSGTITVTQTAHGLSTGNYVVFSGATSFNGIPAAVLNNISYQITVVNTNSYTFLTPGNNPTNSNAGTVVTATGSGSGGGSSVTVLEQSFASGSEGWGTAYTGAGVGQQLRLWSADNFGSDLIYAPRGGPIFYWANANGVSTRGKYLQNIANTTTLLTDTSTFTTGASSITVSSANAAYIYPFMYITGTNLAAGTQVASNYVTGSTTVPITVATTGNNSGTYNFYYDGSYIPSSTYQILASDVQEFIIAFGAQPYTPGTTSANTTFNPLLVRWSDQANPLQWVPAITNQAGEYALGNGSYIMGARSTRQEILVWTDSALYSMQYIGTPYVWGFQLLMDNISIMSPNAMITVNNITYWMGRDRFYMYNGTVSTLPCALKQYVFDDINVDQSYQVFTGANEGFNEVWWFYVSNSSSGTSVDKYVVYNYLDKVWYYGTMTRSAWLQTGILPNPIAADYNNRLLNHEAGNDDNSTNVTQPITAYVQSSDVELSADDSGENFGFVWRMLPDVNFNGSTANNPQVTITLLPRRNSGDAYSPVQDGSPTWPPTNQVQNPLVQSSNNYQAAPEYTVQQFTGQVYTRVRGRQMAFRIESNTIGTAWQLGVPRFDIKADGRR